MANERDRTPQGQPDAPDEPTAPRSPNVRPAPSAGPGEYVGKAQPIDPARRRSAPQGGAPASGAAESPQGPASERPGGDEGTADGVRAESPEERDEPSGEAEPSPSPPSRSPRSAPGGRSARRLRQPSSMSAVDRVRRADFPVVLRGYDRAAVDAYVAEVAQLVAELEATQLPETVVQRALDEVGDETSAILRQAHETSEEITARSRSQAAGRLQRAEQEADGLRRRAEEQARRMENDIQSIWQERSRLLEELRRLADEVLGVADDALDRIPAPEPITGRDTGADEATLTGFDEGEEQPEAGAAPAGGGQEFVPGQGGPEDDTAEHSTGPGRPGS